jgi:homoserine kinase type II
MSVFTKVSLEEASQWVKRCYSIGKVLNLRGIESGIENTNFYLDTDHGTFVLTLFEKLTASELPFYLNLMAHLSSHGVPVPTPIKNLENRFWGISMVSRPPLLVVFQGHRVQLPPVIRCVWLENSSHICI